MLSPSAYSPHHADWPARSLSPVRCPSSLSPAAHLSSPVGRPNLSPPALPLPSALVCPLSTRRFPLPPGDPVSLAGSPVDAPRTLSSLSCRTPVRPSLLPTSPRPWAGPIFPPADLISPSQSRCPPPGDPLSLAGRRAPYLELFERGAQLLVALPRPRRHVVPARLQQRHPVLDGRRRVRVAARQDVPACACAKTSRHVSPRQRTHSLWLEQVLSF